ncbi:MAG: DMT family transporter [Candidatus Tectomicrobia bacterium]|nr:DMT family transporter [Candidatus Tectomicrobia bacterium]
MPTISAEVFALLNALFYSVADVSLRGALRFASPATCMAGMRLSQFLFYAVLVLVIQGVPSPPAAGVAWFVVAGLVSPALFNMLYIIGMNRIGIARASPIKGASPLFGTAAAVLMLGERPLPIHLLGILFVAAGIAAISLEPPTTAERSWRRRDALFPIAAACCSGVGAVLFKFGLAVYPAPLAGATLASLSAAVATWAAILAVGRFQPRQLRTKAGPLVLLAGSIGGTGMFFHLAALQVGAVSVVLPLVQISPLLTVGIAFFFLHGLERVTLRIVLGALLTVAGGVLVTAFHG